MLTTTLLCFIASASPIKVAAARFNAVDLSEGRADFYTEHFADRLADEGVDVVTPREVQTLLGLERQKVLLGCNEMTSSCLAEIGSALGVDGIVLGDVAKVGDGYQMNVKVISAVNGRRYSARSAKVATEGALLEALTLAAKQIASDLSRELEKPLGARRVNTDIIVADKPAPEPEPSAARKLWWLPVVAGVAIGAGGGVGLGVAESHRAQLETENLTPQQAKELLSSGQTARTLGWVGVGAGAAAIGTGLLMLALGKDAPAVPVASVSSNGAVVGLSGSFP